MRLVAESGLWTTGPAQRAAPLTAVLEVSGAVLSWTIDDPPDDTATHIAFTDVSRADWLWRVVGETGHVALASALTTHPDGDLELTGVDVVSGSTTPLRRLALGHWLRRWWPASQRDGIAGLDRALLDAEVALLTAGAQVFFTDDTLDSDVAALLAPHPATLLSHLRTDDRRVLELVGAAARLADVAGIDGSDWAELSAAVDDSAVIATLPSGRRDDYALAAGTDAAPRGAASIGRGVASINWGAVPPGIFDAAEDTVDWSVEPAGPGVVAVIRAAVVGPDAPTGVPVRVHSGEVSGAGALDAGGRATLELADAHQHAMAEAAAWNHDWPQTSVVIGADIEESRHTRDRVRHWVRARLDRPPANAFLAEILASESAY
ncbi:hypothetical protein PJK45_21950 [Mycobacterium kansasii]|uniref:Uncharacterized protein n=3 Tax=Mycobacterium kansasii TaxID=1768 RepID=A0A653F1T1_MYCKA|nr:hypothetical protein [Mycobacterium kansasii]AGZ51166.1 hypothetical protein MKAN_13495 [Mycobacterium kansasii ATCC 12478]ARG57065.1 hypothetical protein B1T43_15585 [Mycobacterium kansasii]ARG62583.1 hypothetical protein B1T45_16110 [Mycobacterium kansasii]ARG70205.1 hypothetical protein B1T47_15345 [Mycobacterium kansasii]ARG75185.1 hypothetical protein B1T51_12760 [Mycobacterium kansasii]